MVTLGLWWRPGRSWVEGSWGCNAHKEHGWQRLLFRLRHEAGRALPGGPPWTFADGYVFIRGISGQSLRLWQAGAIKEGRSMIKTSACHQAARTLHKEPRTSIRLQGEPRRSAQPHQHLNKENIHCVNSNEQRWFSGHSNLASVWWVGGALCYPEMVVFCVCSFHSPFLPLP